MGTIFEELTDHNILIVLSLVAIAVLVILYKADLAKDVINSVVSGLLGMAYGSSKLAGTKS